ncbi:unnamed protein product [Heterobilharzia americana]|nr:unnamed protein product [Heterobilharzia americana]CAH8499958.1 unnamed protein product [Heterobilharzia americana]
MKPLDHQSDGHESRSETIILLRRRRMTLKGDFNFWQHPNKSQLPKPLSHSRFLQQVVIIIIIIVCLLDSRWNIRLQLHVSTSLSSLQSFQPGSTTVHKLSFIPHIISYMSPSAPTPNSSFPFLVPLVGLA